jgi:hypothetical protein
LIAFCLSLAAPLADCGPSAKLGSLGGTLVSVAQASSPRATSAALAIVGLLALSAAVAIGWGRHDAWRGFSASYLVNFMFFLSISL